MSAVTRMAIEELSVADRPILNEGIVHNSLQAVGSQKLRAFNARLMPSVDPATLIGVKIPTIRELAKLLLKTYNVRTYLSCLPHTYWEELILHGVLLGVYKSYEELLPHLEYFLGYITDWAVCDTLDLKVLERNRDALLPQCVDWLHDEREYVVRFSIISLMKYALRKHFDPRVLDWVSGVRRPEYYIQMAQAWFFAEGVILYPQEVLPYLTTERLLPEVLNKALQKACESRRPTEEQKKRFRAMKVSISH